MKKRNIINRLISKIAAKGFFDLLSDETYLRIVFWARTGNRLNLSRPQTFNEKLQWLKLHYRKDIMCKLVDKYEVKKIVSDLIGEEHIIPTLGLWNSFDEIDFDKLPDKFVLKCTHDSGGLVICKNKDTFDISKAKKIITNSLKTRYYLHGREWPYKYVQPRIIAEQYMTDESSCELKDYKVFNFDGEPKLIQVDYDRFNGHKRNLYDLDWNYVDAQIEFPTDPNRIIEKPQNLTQMLDFARILSNGFPHARTDFYSVNGKVYFGEITFFHGGGFEYFAPEEFEQKFSSYLNL